MSMYIVKKIVEQHRSREMGEGWNVVLPGHPIEVARRLGPDELTERDVWDIFNAHVCLTKHHSITKLYDQSEQIVAWALSDRGMYEAFIFRVLPEEKKAA